MGSPTAMGDDSHVRLGLYLYEVTKAGALNTETIRIDEEADRKRKSPLGLEAHYLLTAFPNPIAEGEANGILDQHELLGRAMQAFYDTDTIEPEHLPAALGDQPVTITLDQRDPAEMADIWSLFPDVPKQPCATYTVGPVRIDSTQSTPFERVSERHFAPSRE